MEHKDEKLTQLMKMARRDMPFEDFEDRVMARIDKVEQDKAALVNYRRYSLLFFVLGTIFGLGLNYLLAETIDLLDIPQGGKKMLELATQLAYVVLIVLLTDKIIHLLNISKKSANIPR